MKKLIYVPFIFLLGCSEPEMILPNVMSKGDIFNVKESIVTNGQSIHFDLQNKGIYTLTLINGKTNQVISREKFVGKVGENIKHIYTKSLPKGYLYMVLGDENKNEINKTQIIIK
jgi:hypothetical protein